MQATAYSTMNPMHSSPFASRRSLLAPLALSLGLAACASPGGHPQDPLEPMNRATFRFNDTVDTYALRPVAQVYAEAPLPVRTGVSNFFGNIKDAWTGVNNLLQGKPLDGVSDFGRVLVNSTIGMLGVFDVATDMGLEKHEEDLGQTLAVWGVGDGPYLVLPFLGPSTVRDSVALIGDMQADPVGHVDDIPTRNSLRGLRIVNARANLLGADEAANQAALDKYEYFRSFYLQYRRSQVYDGQPPRIKDPDDEAGLDDAPETPSAALTLDAQPQTVSVAPVENPQ